MPLIVNGVTVEKVICNGVELEEMYANGAKVFESKINCLGGFVQQNISGGLATVTQSSSYLSVSHDGYKGNELVQDIYTGNATKLHFTGSYELAGGSGASLIINIRNTSGITPLTYYTDTTFNDVTIDVPQNTTIQIVLGFYAYDTPHGAQAEFTQMYLK